MMDRYGDGGQPGEADPYAELRRALLKEPTRGPAVSRWQVQLAIGVLTALVVWPLAAWDRGEDPIRTEVAGETLERTAPPSTEIPAPTVTTAGPDTTTSTTATTVPAVVPPPTAPTTTRPATAPTTTATTTATTSTTATTVPRAVRRQTTSQVFPGVQLTLTAAAPASGAVRTAEFQVTAEFGDPRVLRVVHLDFGDGTGADVETRAWDCWDPAAPNPNVVTGPSHSYTGAGTYTVVVTVRTGVCAIGQDEPVSEETVTLPLPIVVP